MKLRAKWRKAATRYMIDNVPAVAAAAVEPFLKDTNSKIESILSILIGLDYDGSGTEGPPITLPHLPPCVVKLEEAAESATFEADTSQPSTTFPIEDTNYFESLLDISILLARDHRNAS